MKRQFCWAMAVAGLLGTQGASAIDNRGPLAPSAPEGGSATIVDGTMNAEVVNGCYVLVTGTVETPDVGGTAFAWINRWDDGNFRGGTELSFAANGTSQSYCLVHQQTEPVLQGAFGLGMYLENGLGLAATVTFDSDGGVDVSDVCTGDAPVCPSSALEVPAVDRTGIIVLSLLLAGAAIFGLARRRAAAR